MRNLSYAAVVVCAGVICTGCSSKTAPGGQTSSANRIDWGAISNASPGEIIAELRRRERGGDIQTFSAENKPKMNATSQGLQGVDSHTLAKLFEFKIESIYGPDQRKDVRELIPGTDDGVIALADCVPAVFPTNSIIWSGDWTNTSEFFLGTSTLVLTNFGQQRQLCPDQRFVEQPSGASGTAGVVGTNLILTVGHCLTGALDSHVFVFGFKMLDASNAVTKVSNRQIYRPVRIVGVSSNDADWAVVQVDRKIEGHAVLRIARYDPRDSDPARQGVTNGEAIFAIGYPCGLPVKVTPPAQVQSNVLMWPTFLANLDTFAGNSGSPVFAKHGANYEIVGVLSRGLYDFDFVAEINCRMALRYSEDSGGEECTRTTQFASLIPDIR